MSPCEDTRPSLRKVNQIVIGDRLKEVPGWDSGSGGQKGWASGMSWE